MHSCHACFRLFPNQKALASHIFSTSCKSFEPSPLKTQSQKKRKKNRGRPKSLKNYTISEAVSIKESDESNFDCYDSTPLPPSLLQNSKSLKDRIENNIGSAERLLNKSRIDETDFNTVTIANLLGREAFEISEDAVAPTKDSFNFPPSIIAQIHLLNIIGKHNVDLLIFDEIVEWLKFHTRKGKIDWSNSVWFRREQLLARLGNYGDASSLKPVTIDVPIPLNKTVASVPIFNFEKMVLTLFHDKTLMHENNLIPNFDIVTGKSTTNQRPETYGAYHTGTLYQKCWDRLCKQPGDMLLPLRFFLDKTHGDFHGVLCTTPIIYTLAFFKESCQNNPDFWRPQCYIPNITYGESKDVTAATILKLQSLHNCIKIGIEPIKRVMDAGGIKTTYKGNQVTLKPVLFIVNGDMSGMNELCAHFNNNTNKQRPYRDCKCGMDDLDSNNPLCEYITAEEVRNATMDSNINKNRTMTSISKYDINNGFEGIELFDPTAGIFGHCPSGGLHLFGDGIYEYFFEVMHDMVGPNKSNKKEKKKINDLFKNVCNSMSRQSERDFPRRALRNGPMDGTKLGGNERRGNLFCFLICMHTTEGKRILQPLFESFEGVDYEGVIYSIKLILSFEKWCHDENSKAEVENSDSLIAEMKVQIKKNLPRDIVCKKGNGWRFPKFHGISKYPFYIKRFGSGYHLNEGVGESNLKKFVKKPSHNTQKRACGYTDQIAKQYHETTVQEITYELVKEECGDYLCLPNNDIDLNLTRGEYRMEFSEQVNESRTSNVMWKSHKRQKLNEDISSDLKKVLMSHAERAGYKDAFEVVGFTELKMKRNGEQLIYRSTMDLFNTAWFDFCLLEYFDNNVTKFAPAKILGFVKFFDGFSIPEGGSVEDTYVVVHTGDFIDLEKDSRDFITSFRLGLGNEYWEILSCDSIAGPLLAVPDFGGEDRMLYWTATRYGKWGRYFGNLIDIH